MADRFTPGPWKINRTCSRKWGERYFEIWTDEGLQGDRPIARVDGDNAVWLEEGQDIANARLIAAAPELLAALRKAYEPGVREAALEAVEAFSALKLHSNDDNTARIISDLSTFVRAVDALRGLREALTTPALPTDVAELLRRVEG
jgi:hypothetical protein